MKKLIMIAVALLGMATVSEAQTEPKYQMVVKTKYGTATYASDNILSVYFGQKPTIMPAAEAGSDLADYFEGVDFATYDNVIIPLNPGEYTVNKAIAIPAGKTVRIIGNGVDKTTVVMAADAQIIFQKGLQIEKVKIDATETTKPLLLMDGTPAGIVNAKGFYEAGDVTIKDAYITGLTQELFFANKQKYLIDNFTIENSYIEYFGGNKNVISTQNGGVIAKLLVNNSTIASTVENNTGFLYTSQSGQKATEAGLEMQEFIFRNSTIYGIANGKNTFNHRQNGQKWLSFEVKNCVVVNTGKNGQFLCGLNGGQNSANPKYTVSGNSFAWGGADVSATELEKISNTGLTDIQSVVGLPVFAYDIPETGDMSLDFCPQVVAKIGDPRWLAKAPVAVSVASGGDIAAAIAAAAAANPGKALALVLAAGGEYKVTEAIAPNTALSIYGDEAAPATIDATELTTPFIQMSNVPGVEANDKNFFAIGNVTIKNVKVTGLTKQFFYANKTKYLIDNFTIENSFIEYFGGNANVIDTNGGGVIGKLLVSKSTIASTVGNNTGFLYTSQSGQKATEAGLEMQYFVFQNSTIYGIANGKNTFAHRQNGQKWLSFEVKNCIAVNTGKSGQFLVGLNAGQNSANPVFTVSGNAFNWGDADVSATELEKISNTGLTDIQSVEGVVVFAKDIAETGDLTLGECAAKTAGIGDPRWIAAEAVVE